MKIKGLCIFKAIGVGKYRCRTVYLTLNHGSFELGKRAIKNLFPNLSNGQDYAVQEVNVTIEALNKPVGNDARD